jgi:hypothetical protein
MTLEQIFYLTQSVAAIGVIASLIFLGLQTKDNARAVRAATTQSVQGDYTAWYRLLAERPEILAVCTKGYASPSALAGDEKALFLVVLQIVLFNAQNAFTQWRNGHLPEGVWTMYEKGLAISMRTPGGLMYWHERRWLFSSAFQAEVDAAISKPMDPQARSIFAMSGADTSANHAANLRNPDGGR